MSFNDYSCPDLILPGSPTFCRRPACKKPAARGEHNRLRIDHCTIIDFVRSLAAAIIEKWEVAPEHDKGGCLIQIRTIQDQISAMRHRYPRHAAQPSQLAWVDHWSPAA